MARDDDGQPPQAEARRHRADRHCRHPAPAGLRRCRPFCRSRASARQIIAHRDVGDHLPGVGAIFSPRFADTVVRISANPTTVHRTPRKTAFRGGSRQQALRWKEFLLLRRDPWLVSQSLMQLLYLVPPALLLVRSFSDRSAATMLVTPVIVMAAGQLAGGLAWLTFRARTRPTWWPPRRCRRRASPAPRSKWC